MQTQSGNATRDTNPANAAAASDGRAALERRNLEINEAENRGDRKSLDGFLAPELAFQRADQSVDDRFVFLDKVEEKKGDRRISLAEPVKVCGDLGFVHCIVEVNHKQYRNFRLFVRRDNDWKLLGWANQALPGPPGGQQPAVAQ
jgi:hypothetical protein